MANEAENIQKEGQQKVKVMEEAGMIVIDDFVNLVHFCG